VYVGERSSENMNIKKYIPFSSGYWLYWFYSAIVGFVPGGSLVKF
jgi:hypothetical protein